MNVIDAHHHLWSAPGRVGWLAEPGHEVLRRPYSMADLHPLLQCEKVDGTVLVECGSGRHDELAVMLTVAAEYPEVLGVVGWVDTATGNVTTQIERAFAHPLADRWLMGLRIQAQSEPADHLEQPEAQEAAAALANRGRVLEIVARPQHLSGAAALARNQSRCRIVLDHAGKPDIAGDTDETFAQWRTVMADLASLPNIYVKLSGLVTEADWTSWTPDTLRPYVKVLLELFGARRLMVGSDWPACLLAADYHAVMEAARDCLDNISEEERHCLFGRTAIAVYGLQP
ncbi:MULTISPECIES: amidohydrolase family protein [Mycobacteriaceae]|uniref:amidohydrolase family protein n=1 Tax=Mycobacteriaceae TaxID=1762 RepID=UPI0009791F73|nr:amidohydrolase family protein [Mycobacterium sp. MS1601]AQA07201.1 hypothetical protein BVC93_32485 [Mycobacterium sp. MS1601]